MEVIINTIISEFSDFNDLSEFIIVVIRLLLAAVLGGLLGLEREQRGKAAGIRTHMLVCMGRLCLYLYLSKRVSLMRK